MRRTEKVKGDACCLQEVRWRGEGARFFEGTREEGTNHRRKTRGARRLMPPLVSFQLPLQFFEPVPTFTLTSSSCHNSSLIFLSFRYFVWLCL